MSLHRSCVPALAEALGIRPERIILIAALTVSTDPDGYWRKLKQRLRDDEGASETVTNCHELKMRAIDGKMRATVAAEYVTAERPTSPLSRVTSIRVVPIRVVPIRP